MRPGHYPERDQEQCASSGLYKTLAIFCAPHPVSSSLLLSLPLLFSLCHPLLLSLCYPLLFSLRHPVSLHQASYSLGR
ncbi:hypothetical protein BDV32DRAFT_123784 [Aspergillus pseudonomiae]|nr:hypothetical protein BDV32DRAFT_123784 [Aspergillus pseudonomiae]